ncbi:glycosyltransferase [Microbacterium suwonense]|uniref:D-inositol 3-phosphate glycosyltransferase n=1 Tax=Microbacterium suwonense TaxID=683047 RepID=A0ABN6X5D9_9MICO|nr:glycosyltransferase [Microbacterium suwonense]BDZ39243.1 glycosyltransferase WbuB [Microbacterium suwonense]
MSTITAPDGQVLFIGVNYAPEPTGISPYTTGMAQGLAKRGHRVGVITSYPHYPWWRIPEEHATLPRRTDAEGVTITRVHHYIPRRPGSLRRALFEVTFGIRALFSHWNSPSVVVVVSPALFASRLVALRARLQGLPVIVWVQDIYTLGVGQASDGAGSRAVARVERSLADTATRVVVIHDRFRRMFQEDVGTSTPIDVVRNWSHVPDVSSAARAATRQRMGWGDDEIIVLHAGAMGAKQGLENVVHAAREATRRGSRVRFVLLGDGNQRTHLESLGGDPRLQFVDPLPDERFLETLAAADVLLANERPGLTEMSVPSKLTTYFATGLPVVAAVDASSTTHDEILASGAGPVVPAGDPGALVDAIEELSDHPGMAAAFGAAGRAYRAAHLTPDAAVDAFERTLASVAPREVAVRA